MDFLPDQFIVQFKGRLIGFISSWVYLLVTLSFYLITEPLSPNRINTMVVISILSLVWGLMLYRRIRIIEDTSETRLNSAAQGYVELKGIVSLYDGEIIRGLKQDQLPPMVWHRNTFTTSSAGFILEDDKGRCTIDPRDAEVITPLYFYNNMHYHSIYPGEYIYVLGQLETLKKHKTEFEIDGLITSKVVEWKKNQHSFLDYFDANKDGVIDDSEMDTAKHAAIREVDADVEIDYQKPPTHVVSTPEDGRPFLLSSIHPDKLITRYNRALIVHLFIWAYLSLLILVK